jgi:hypothetical protein
MKLTKITTLLLTSTLLVFASCEKDAGQLDAALEEGYLQVEILLNPSIHPYAETVGLNVEASRVGDVSRVELVTFEPLIFDELVEPTAKQLGTRAVLTPGGYANSEFDFVSAGQESSFILTASGNTDLLDAGSNTVATIRAVGNFLIADGITTKRVLFLDMNKLVNVEKDGSIDFSFRGNLSAEQAFQLLDPKEVGSITGSITRTTSTPRQTHRLVVYAYPVGGFDSVEEIENGFRSAVISANVRRNDEFTFPVLSEGAFELVVVEYQDENQDNILEFKNLLVADDDVNQTTRLTRVSKNSQTQIEVKLGGIAID